MNKIDHRVAIVLCALAFLSTSSPGRAEDYTTPIPEQSVALPGVHGTHIDTGGGYDLVTGGGVRRIVDFKVPGSVGQYPLEAVRTYSTNNGGWSTSWCWSARKRYGSLPSQYSWEDPGAYFDLRVFYPDGRNARFGLVSTPAPSDTVETTLDAGGKITGFTLKFVDGGSMRFEMYVSTTFSRSYRPIYRDDPYGLRYTFDYAGRTTSVPYQVTDASGRWLRFSETMTYIESSAGQWVSLSSDRTTATYWDGTSASYEYARVDPLIAVTRLKKAYDVKAVGPMRSIEYVYSYYEDVSVLPTSNPDRLKLIEVQEERLPGGPMVSQRTITSRTAPDYIPARAPLAGYEVRGDGPSRNFTMNLDGQVMTATTFTGATESYSYDAGAGFPKTITDARGYVTNIEHNGPQKRVSKITYPDTSYRLYSWVNTAFLQSETNELGRVTTYTRDASNRVTRIDYPDGSYETRSYGTFNKVMQTRNRNGSYNYYDYDSRGNLYRRWPATFNAKSTSEPYFEYAYYPVGHAWVDRVQTERDPRGNVTTFEYNARGQVTKATQPGGTYLSYGYDNYGNKIWEENELRNRTSYTYDAYNRLLTVTDPLNRTTTYTYDHYGFSGDPMTHTAAKVRLETSPSTKQTAYTYDANFLLKTETKGYGTLDAGTTTYNYDNVGNQTSVVDAMNRTTTFVYDNRNRRTKQTAPLSRITQWQYDAASNVTKVTNPDSTFTLKSYNSMNQVLTSTDEMSRVTTYTYWPSGQVHTITDPRGSTHEQIYDAQDRLIERKYPLPGGGGYGTNERWEFDPAGNVSAYYNRSNQKQNFVYDNRNRETRRYWDGGVGPDVQTGYDARSRVLWKTNANGRLDYTYNAADEVTQDKQTVTGGPIVHLNPSYNADGQRTVVWTSAGTWLGYDYNGRRALSEIQQWGGQPITWAAYSYNAAGERRFRTHYNGSESDYNYDAAGRSNYLHTYKSSGSWILKQTTGKDVRDRRTWTVRDDYYGEAYSYQADSQLTQYRNNIYRPDLYPANPASWTDTFAYDTGGNRTSWNENGAVKNYTTNALNQYTTVTGAAIAHNDGRGNLTQWKEWTYAYDAENRLTSAGKTGYTVTFYYDPAGRLVRLNRNGTSEYRYYDGTQVFLRTQANGTWIDFTIWGPRPDEVVSRYSATSGWLFYHQDFSGGTAAITDMGQSVVERYLYDAYGRELLYNGSWQPIVSSPTNNSWTFTGQEFMADIGLNNYKNRFYHSTLGRFIQNDPIRFNGGDLNLYRYVGNNPINLVDPTGLLNEAGREKERKTAEEADQDNGGKERTEGVTMSDGSVLRSSGDAQAWGIANGRKVFSEVSSAMDSEPPMQLPEFAAVTIEQAAVIGELTVQVASLVQSAVGAAFGELEPLAEGFTEVGTALENTGYVPFMEAGQTLQLVGFASSIGKETAQIGMTNFESSVERTRQYLNNEWSQQFRRNP